MDLGHDAHHEGAVKTRPPQGCFKFILMGISNPDLEDKCILNTKL